VSLINNLHVLINIVPDLINLFLPGFVFMLTYSWMNVKKYDVSVLTIGSLFISYTISVFYSAMHNFIFKNYDISEAVKSLIYIISGLIFPFVIIYFQNTKIFKKLLRKINHKSIHEDIFDDIIDYNRKTMLQVYIKNSPVVYIGTFKIREEKGLDSYIALINYASMDKNTKTIIFKPSKNDLNSSVIINLRDIERIEVIYEKESDLWKYLIN
jgi:hypothetical protein